MMQHLALEPIKTITPEYVEQRYQALLDEVCGVLPLDQWHQQPTRLGFTNHKTKYGLATPSGEVQINRAFLSTEAVNKLSATLRHEFAHFAVGLHHHHNRTFQWMERRFGVDPRVDLSQEEGMVLANIPCKYTVIAHMADGTEINVGEAHRKTKLYTDYPRKGRPDLSIRGQWVLRFSFLENG